MSPVFTVLSDNSSMELMLFVELNRLEIKFTLLYFTLLYFTSFWRLLFPFDWGLCGEYRQPIAQVGE